MGPGPGSGAPRRSWALVSCSLTSPPWLMLGGGGETSTRDPEAASWGWGAESQQGCPTSRDPPPCPSPPALLPPSLLPLPFSPCSPCKWRCSVQAPARSPAGVPDGAGPRQQAWLWLAPTPSRGPGGAGRRARPVADGGPRRGCPGRRLTVRQMAGRVGVRSSPICSPPWWAFSRPPGAELR